MLYYSKDKSMSSHLPLSIENGNFDRKVFNNDNADRKR